jgi:hypothetical protein
MKVYLAGPMSGIKDFNFPTFMTAAKALREQGHEVFNPAERDVEVHGEDLFKGSGDVAESETKGFSLREALAADTDYICRQAEAIAMLPGWERSSGANAEWMLAKALRLEFMYL